MNGESLETNTTTRTTGPDGGGIGTMTRTIARAAARAIRTTMTTTRLGGATTSTTGHVDITTMICSKTEVDDDVRGGVGLHGFWNRTLHHPPDERQFPTECQ